MKRTVWLGLWCGIFFLFPIVVMAEPQIMIGVNCTMEKGGSEEASILKFKELLEKKSDGRMKVNPLLGGLLGDEKDVLEKLKNGAAQMALTGGLFRTMYAKEYDPISIPFYMKSWECIQTLMKGSVGSKIRELAMLQGGLIDFGIQKRAPRRMTSNKKIIEPSDIDGLKMRLPQIPLWLDIWKELGAVSVAIPATEIYDAMKNNIVEAHENTLASPYSRKLYEVQKYIIMTDHVYYPWHWTASKIWFDTLSPNDQKLIRECVEEARIYGDTIEDEKDQFFVTELKKLGMEFITPNLERIRKKAMPAIQKAVKELAPEVVEEVDKVCN